MYLMCDQFKDFIFIWKGAETIVISYVLLVAPCNK